MSNGFQTIHIGKRDILIRIKCDFNELMQCDSQSQEYFIADKSSGEAIDSKYIENCEGMSVCTDNNVQTAVFFRLRLNTTETFLKVFIGRWSAGRWWS